jgi:hypothetical protein
LGQQQNDCHLRSKQRRYCYFCGGLDTPWVRGHLGIVRWFFSRN